MHIHFMTVNICFRRSVNTFQGDHLFYTVHSVPRELRKKLCLTRLKHTCREFPDGPVVRTWVQSLVGELRSHKPCNQNKQTNKTKNQKTHLHSSYLKSAHLAISFFYKRLIIHIPNNSPIKGTIKWFLDYLKSCATITTINFRTFESP